MQDRVLEIGSHAAGYAGRLFAHAGADVVRAEVAALNVPSWASMRANDLYLHRGKRRVTITDLAMLAELATAADIVICEASSADAVLELGFEQWQDVVKVAITPFGMTGPKRNWHATPNVVLAMGGYTQVMGDAEKAPLSLPGHYLEYQSGALAYTASNAQRFSESGGGSVDIGMLETLMSLSQFTTVRWHCTQDIRSRHGSDFWFVTPSNLFACADGWIYLNIIPAFWDPCTLFVGLPEMLLDPRFSDNDLRMTHRDVLHGLIAEALAPVTKAELIARAEHTRVPVGMVQSFDEVLADPHLAARDFWVTAEDPHTGQVLQVPGMPFRIGDNPWPQMSLTNPEPGND